MFIGILWMMLPHAYHERLINESDSNHVFHIIQGLITTLIGLSIMLCNNKLSNKIEKNNKN
ncbi:hypothetical protein HYX18_00245 [Candidatus Woesearchaeota archaeon]|nr:hypothetical protein [Candidatus Woesearchaeota archaeon]